MKEVLKTIKNLNISKAINVLGYFFNKIFKPEKNFFQPISVDIEPTILCNLNCPFCHSKNLKREKKGIDLSEFKNILNNFPLSLKINIQGMGEPLVNPEIFSMIKFAKEQKKFVTVTTNATLLNKESAVKLIASGLDRLVISLDSADKEAYEKVRIGANFDKTIANISEFMKLRGKKNGPEVIVWMLALKETIGGLSEMVDLAKKLGVDRLVLQSNLTGWGKDEWLEKNRELEAKNIEKLIADAKKKAKESKVKFSVNNKYTIFKKDKKEKCNWPWGGAYVATDGRVAPCCLVADPAVASLGNIFSESFDDIWNNKEYRKLRQGTKSGNIPAYCRQCYLNK